MSWDGTKKTYICPCGVGKVVETSESDDWGRSRYHNWIDCEKCKKEYEYINISPRSRPDRAREEWVNKKTRKVFYPVTLINTENI